MESHTQVKTSSMIATESSSLENLPRDTEIGGGLGEMIANCPPFYQNRNLLKLYLLMIPGCLVPAVTLGYDSAMLNGLQSVPNWDTCEYENQRMYES